MRSTLKPIYYIVVCDKSSSCEPLKSVWLKLSNGFCKTNIIPIVFYVPNVLRSFVLSLKLKKKSIGRRAFQKEYEHAYFNKENYIYYELVSLQVRNTEIYTITKGVIRDSHFRRSQLLNLKKIRWFWRKYNFPRKFNFNFPIKDRFPNIFFSTAVSLKSVYVILNIRKVLIWLLVVRC